MSQRAICVGINQFRHFPQFALNGCVNDARRMAEHCRTALGFKAREVRTLIDRKATKAAVMGALAQAVEDARAGKLQRILFSFSSHGTQVADASGDEPDGMDEAFVPYDVAQKDDRWDPAHIITDDEFNDLFQRLPAGVLLEVFLDTCHSGSGLRGAEFSLNAPRPRYIAPPAAEFQGPVKQRSVSGFALGGQRGASAAAPATKTRKTAKAKTSAAAASASDAVTGQHHVLWTGCKSNQTSADAFIEGAYHGAFTWHYLKVVGASAQPLARKTVIARVRAAMKGQYAQVPQLETSATLRSGVMVL